ncbi:MAG: hypothetical protein MJ238_02430 [Bacilli bacterium]|nr:hypothetical protein [Bacilli bacterium]
MKNVNPSKIKTIRQWLEIALGVLTVVVGVLFIIRCQNLYFSNKGVLDHPYTYETIWQAFWPIMAVVILFGLLLIACGVLSLIFPTTGRWRFSRSNQESLSLLESRLPKDVVEGCEANYASIKKARKTRLVAYIIAAVICLISFVMISLYLFNPKNFQGTGASDHIKEATRCMEHVVPFVILGFGGVFIAFTVSEISAKKELDDVKAVLKASKGGIKPAPKKSINAKVLWAIRGSVLLVAIVFVVWGVINGGAAEMLKKAVNLCSECLGLG